MQYTYTGSYDDHICVAPQMLMTPHSIEAQGLTSDGADDMTACEEAADDEKSPCFDHEAFLKA